jgi:hypothetical protein
LWNSGRTAARLPLPRRLHQQHPRTDRSRSLPPRPRHHRGRLRRPQRRAARARTIGEVHRQRCLARPRRDRVQPDPCCCPDRQRDPRPCPHRHRAPHPGQRGCPDREPSPPLAVAPTPGLAMADPTRTPLRHRPQPARCRRPLTTRPHTHEQGTPVEKPGTPAATPRSPTESPLGPSQKHGNRPNECASADRG